MTFTYDPLTTIGKVRMVIPDRTESDAFWIDEEIESLIIENDNNWRRAAANALEIMASDAAIVDRVIRVQNLSTDGAAVSRALLQRAALLRQQAEQVEIAAGDGFDTIEMIVTDFGYRQRLVNEALRE